MKNQKITYKKMTYKKIGMKIQVRPVLVDSDSICREYAAFSCYPGGTREKADWGRERAKMKEALLPFVREAVKKQMKEEREYFRSRPSLAARQFESIFGQGQIISTLTYRVCEQMEQQLRHERLRKGR